MQTTKENQKWNFEPLKELMFNEIGKSELITILEEIEFNYISFLLNSVNTSEGSQIFYDSVNEHSALHRLIKALKQV